MVEHQVNAARLLTAGYVTFDIIEHCGGAGEYWHAVGGTCGNVSVFTSALGLDVTVLCRIGEDDRGDFLWDGLDEWGVNVSLVERIRGLPTPAVVQETRSRGDKTHHFTFRCPGCHIRLAKSGVVSMKQAEVVSSNIGEFDVYYFDRATRSTVHLAEAAREAGLIVIFEPTSIPRTSLALRAASLSDIVKFAKRRRRCATDWRPAVGSSTRLMLETLGDQGVQLWPWLEDDWGEVVAMPAVEPKWICDTAGAGDWLTAGVLIHQLMFRGALAIESVEESVAVGQRLSALSLEFSGPSGVLVNAGPEAIEEIFHGISPRLAEPNVVARGYSRSSNRSTPYTACSLCLSPFAQLKTITG